MAETKSTKTTTKPFVALRNAETAAGSFTHNELVFLHEDEMVKGLVEGGYLMPQKDYLEQTDEATLLQTEREQGVSARES